MKPLLIGIAGGSASGKTSIAKQLKDYFGDQQSVHIISMDDYYKDQSNIPFEERIEVNYDHPFAFDTDLMIEHLRCLKEGKSIEKPTYDFTKHTRSDITEVVRVVDVLVIEGLLLLDNPNVRDLLDIKVFVDAPADVRFIRRLSRDVRKRGREMMQVMDHYMTTVRVMHEQFIEPSKRYADIIIPEGARNKVAIDLLTTKISSIINKENRSE
jgi:uridine kinase